MAEGKKKESSVLFSLRELRNLEEERVSEEEAERQRKESELAQAQEAEARRIREEEEARLRAEQDAEAARVAAIERERRDEQLRLEEAERRARVDAQERIERERMAQEMQIRSIEAQKKRPVGLMVGVAGLVIVVAGLGIFLYNQKQESERKQKEAAAQIAALQADIEKRSNELDELRSQEKKQFDALLAAKSDDEKAAAQRKLDQTKANIEAKAEALRKLRKKSSSRKGGSKAKPKKPKGIKVKCDPNDPLCGI